MIRTDRRFRALVDASRDEIFVVDRDNVIEYMNPAAMQALGARGSAVGRRLSDCFARDVAAGLEQEIDGARSAQRSTYSERRIPFPSGDRWMSAWLTPVEDEHGERTSVMGVARDITQRHELSELLASQHQLLTALVESAPIGIMLLNRGSDWVCEFSNPILRRLAGNVSLDGARLSEACPALASALTPTLNAAATSGQPQTIDLSVETRQLSVTAVRLRLPAHVRDSLLVLVNDITERRELEQQLLQADKMDAVGRLAGGIAHDFNNLLTPILGYTELVAGTLAPDDTRRRDLEEVSAAAKSATALTRQLLTFSRKHVVHPGAVDLNEVLRRVDRIVRRTIGEDVTISLDLAAESARVVADHNQLEQIVMNLCVNARDAMPQGGALTVQTRNLAIAHPKQGARRVIPPGEYVALEVSDTGTGMPAEVQARIFEPFFTTKGPAKGTGLGLSIVYSIVEHAGGYIGLDSAPGRGTRFTIYLPRTDAEVSAAERSDNDVRSVPGRTAGGTVLIVEDNDGLRRLADRLLRGAGYRTLTAQNAGEALELARSFEGPIDVLLSDIVMPEVDGVTLARQLTRQRPALRILFMSGYTGEDVGRHAALPAGVPLLQKPFTRDTLTRALSDARADQRAACPR